MYLKIMLEIGMGVKDVQKIYKQIEERKREKERELKRRVESLKDRSNGYPKIKLNSEHC